MIRKPPPDAPDDVIVQLCAYVAPYLVRLRKESSRGRRSSTSDAGEAGLGRFLTR